LVKFFHIFEIQTSVLYSGVWSAPHPCYYKGEVEQEAIGRFQDSYPKGFG